MGQIKNLARPVDHIQVLFLAMVEPLTSEQIALSFGNSIIIAGVRAKTMTHLFNWPRISNPSDWGGGSNLIFAHAHLANLVAIGVIDAHQSLMGIAL